MAGFKLFLLNEERNYLGHRIGGVLSSLQDIQNDMPNLGTRHLASLAEEIVNRIREILHSRWSPKYHARLKDLQAIGTALQKAVEDRGDLKELLPAALQALQQVSVKLGVKVSNLPALPEEGGENVGQDQFQLTGQGQPGQPPAQGQAQPGPQMPPGGDIGGPMPPGGEMAMPPGQVTPGPPGASPPMM